MKKKQKWVIPSLLLGISVIYFAMTPIGALRFKIATMGCPISALTFKIMDEPYYMTLDENQIGYSLENPPFEETTQAELINWAVTQHGIFYSADYYGWG